MEKILNDAISYIDSYINRVFSGDQLSMIKREIESLIGEKYTNISVRDNITYKELQSYLSSINEKESIRKANGVYYTPEDVVNFMVNNAEKLFLSNDKLQSLNGISSKTNRLKNCKNATIYDPTCGTGEFLIAFLRKKLKNTSNALDSVKSIYGNDLNIVSIRITQLRIILTILEFNNEQSIEGIAEILNNNFSCADYITHDLKMKYDIIIGNPPYIEDNKYNGELPQKYGNIYASVLSNASKQLKKNGVMAFIVPLSYISTPRMQKIRDELFNELQHQYILSYSDRPSCLFQSVHQKLNIIFAKKDDIQYLATGCYTYWYKEERNNLFKSPQIVSNAYDKGSFIPKLGNKMDKIILKKVIRHSKTLASLLDGGNDAVFLNMRVAFWVKAFSIEQNSAEYKKFKCKSKKDADLAICILNSSLFWWYWVTVSDCWHITAKELDGFTVPNILDNKATELAMLLENDLELTKEYIGTKQTEYAFKHKKCVDTIHLIDKYICNHYGLNDEETEYIIDYAYKYRTSGGLNVKSN